MSFLSKQFNLVATMVVLMILSLFISPAFANGNGGNNASASGGFNYTSGSYTGNLNGWTSVTNSGGSLAESGVNGNGYSVQLAGSAGGGTAFSNGTYNVTGVTSNAGGSSWGAAGNYGVTFNGGYGDGKAGVGTDFSSGSFGSFNVNLGGQFAGFDAAASWKF